MFSSSWLRPYPSKADVGSFMWSWYLTRYGTIQLHNRQMSVSEMLSQICLLANHEQGPALSTGTVLYEPWLSVGHAWSCMEGDHDSPIRFTTLLTHGKVIELDSSLLNLCSLHGRDDKLCIYIYIRSLKKQYSQQYTFHRWRITFFKSLTTCLPMLVTR